MNNIYVIDKPAGITSFDVIRKLRKTLQMRRMGHAGTLDPFATGVLLVATGRFTRIADYFHRYDKTYSARFRLGIRTDTDDMTGTVLEHGPLDHVTESEIRSALATMVGTFDQRPPTISAKRVNGKRLYETNRQGLVQEPRLARVTVHEIEIEQIELPDLVVNIRCGSGTYIRSLARDLGEKLGTFGCVKSLRRTRIGPYGSDQAIPLESAEAIRPIAHQQILPDLDALVFRETEMNALRLGNPVFLRNVELTEHQQIRVFSDYCSELLMMARVESVTRAGSRIQPEKLLAVDA